MRGFTFLAAAVTGLLATAASSAEAPAIARPGLARIGSSPAHARGVVFFLEAKVAAGMVAVGTAHTTAPEALARAQRMELALPGSLAQVAVSERYAVAPGRPFNAAEGTVREDYAVFLLTAKPRGVRALAADTRGLIASGARVRVLGPGEGKKHEQELLGTVTASTAERIQIQLDRAGSLEGWGGAPVLAADTNHVVGIVEAAVPGDGVTSVLAAPIGGVIDALREPLDGGKGRRFAAFATRRLHLPRPRRTHPRSPPHQRLAAP